MEFTLNKSLKQINQYKKLSLGNMKPTFIQLTNFRKIFMHDQYKFLNTSHLIVLNSVRNFISRFNSAMCHCIIKFIHSIVSWVTLFKICQSALGEVERDRSHKYTICCFT